MCMGTVIAWVMAGAFGLCSIGAFADALRTGATCDMSRILAKILGLLCLVIAALFAGSQLC